jgi:prolipoprotein diacylglyceryltransferase
MPAGTMFWLYFLLAGLARFVIEFWRINPKVGLGLSGAQWFGLALMAIGLWRLVVSRPTLSRRNS